MCFANTFSQAMACALNFNFNGYLYHLLKVFFMVWAFCALSKIFFFYLKSQRIFFMFFSRSFIVLFSQCALFCILLISSENKHFFISLFAIWISYFIMCINFLLIFFYNIVITLLICRNFYMFCRVYFC